MNRQESEEYFDPEVLLSVTRFEEMLNKQLSYFFEQSDYEDIIDFYFQKEDYDKALVVVEYAIKQHPYTADFLITKADLLISTENCEEALELLVMAENLGSTNNELFILQGDANLFLNNFEKAIESYNLAIPLSQDQEDKEALFLKLSFVLQSNREFDEALYCLEEMISTGPVSEETIEEINLCVLQLGDHKKGIKVFNNIIDRDPYSHLAWYFLGTTYVNAQNYEKALRAFDYSILIKEDFEPAIMEYGITLCVLHRYEESTQYFHKALRINTQADDILKYLGLAYEKMNIMPKARHYYEKAIKICMSQSSIDEYWYLIGRSYDIEEKHTQARHFYLKSTEFFQGKSIYYKALARVEKVLEHGLAVIDAYVMAIKLDPEDSENWVELALCYLNEGDKLTAVDLLLEANGEYKESSEIQYALAGMLIELGRKKEGIILLEDALTSDYSANHLLFDYFPSLELNDKVLEIIDQFNS
ncbi:MAG: tetratricopeptide repeat protein [Bacteroidetes bacterium]|nr:tetratricopeptide repeat protein [Bacteroidota bacterium]